MTFYPSPAQIRGARAMLHWSMLDLARAASLSVSTIKRIEGAQPYPAATTSKLASIQRALEEAGVLFLPDDGKGPGLKLCRPTRTPSRMMVDAASPG